MTAGRYDRLIVEQGATFELALALENPIGTPWNLTGATMRAKLRASYAATSSLLDFDVQTESATGGRIKLFAAASATDALPVGDLPAGFYACVWDLEIIPAPTASSSTYRVLEGRAKIKPQATK